MRANEWDLNRILNRARAFPSVLHGAIKVEIENGQVLYTPAIGGRSFTTLEQAESFVNLNLGMTGSDVFDVYESRSNPAFYRKLRDRVREEGGTTRRDMYHFYDEDQVDVFNKIYQRDGTFYGVFNQDDAVGTHWTIHLPERDKHKQIVMKNGKPVMRELTAGEAARYIEENFGRGIERPTSPKTPKRVKAGMVSKQYEAVTEQKWTVGIMDAQFMQRLEGYNEEVMVRLGTDNKFLMDRAEEALAANKITPADLDKLKRISTLNDSTKTEILSKIGDHISFQAHRTASDASIIMSPKFVEDIARQHDSFGRELQADLKVARARGDKIAERSILREIDLLSDDVADLRELARTGRGMSNARFEGFLAKAIGDDPTGEVAKTVAKMQKNLNQIKGEARVDVLGVLDRYGVDVLTDFGNVKWEAGMSALGPSALATLTRQRDSSRVIVDLQSVSSLPEFFNRQMIEEGTQRLVEKMTTTVTELASGTGEVPPGFMEILKSQERSLDEEVRREARNIRVSIESGANISDNPSLMRSVINMLEKSGIRKKGRPGDEFYYPAIEIPAAQHAYVTPLSSFRDETGRVIDKRVQDLRPGMVQFVDEMFIMHEQDIVNYKVAAGGFDLDDAFNNMYRILDQDGTFSFKTLTLRSPNARMEHMVLELGADDELVQRALRKMGMGDTEIDEYVRAVRSVRDQDERLAQLAPSEQATARMRVNLSASKRTINDTLSRLVASGQVPSADALSNLPPAPTSSFLVKTMRDGVAGYTVEGQPGIFYGLPTEVTGSEELGRFTTLTSEQQNQILRDGMEELKQKVSSGGSGKTLGAWSNRRMVIDHWWGSNAQYLDANTELGRLFHEKLFLYQQETVIDLSIQSGQNLDDSLVIRQANRLMGLMYEITEKAHELGIKDVKIDPASVDAKGGGIRERYRHFYMDEDDPRATFSSLSQGVERYREQARHLREDFVGVPDWIMSNREVRANRVAGSVANKMLQAFRGAVADADMALSSDMKRSIYRMAQDEVIGVVSDTFVDGVASENTYRAVLRAMQLSEGKNTSVLDGLMRMGDQGGLLLQAQNWLHNRMALNNMGYGVSDEAATAAREAYEALGRVQDDVAHLSMQEQNLRLDPIRLRLETLINEMDPRRAVVAPTISQVEDALASVTRVSMPDILDEILDGTTSITREMVEQIDKGIRLANNQSSVRVPEILADLLEQVEGARISPITTDEGYRFLPQIADPSTPLRLPRDGGYVDDTLGSLLYSYQNATDSEVKNTIARQVREAMENSINLMGDWVSADPEAPGVLRNRVFDVMGEAGPEFVERSRVGREAISELTQKASSGRWKDAGFMGRNIISDVFSTSAGKGIRAIVAGTVAAGVVNWMRNKKDHTINDIQGPAFMPGGNPYEEGDAPVGGSLVMPEYSPSNEFGTTYEVRTRGGNFDQNFLGELSTLTGAQVEGTKYNTSNPFQSQSARDRVLSRY